MEEFCGRDFQRALFILRFFVFGTFSVSEIENEICGYKQRIEHVEINYPVIEIKNLVQYAAEVAYKNQTQEQPACSFDDFCFIGFYQCKRPACAKADKHENFEYTKVH